MSHELGRRYRVPARRSVPALHMAWRLALCLLWAASGLAWALPSFEDTECMACHAKPDLVKTEGEKTVSMTVRAEVLRQSVHDRIRCVACHRDIQKPDHKGEKLAPARCDGCHADETEAYADGVHAQAQGPNAAEAARCVDCHGGHEMVSVQRGDSPVFKGNLPATCGRCHSNRALAERHAIKHPEAVTQFVDSIHGRALLERGLIVAPSCNDCHGVHDIRRDKDKDSPIFRTHVAATCGACHRGSQQACERDAHGRLVAQGDERGPTCVTCHTAHEIQARGGLKAKQIADQRCGACHEDRLKTYHETYHGKAMALGFPNVAACYDCHSSHDVLATAQPASRLSSANIVGTCRKCHRLATASFAQYRAHADPTDRKNYPILFWTFVFMTGLILGTFAFFGIHTALWLTRSLREYRRDPQAFRDARAHARADTEWFARFTPFQRFLHYLIITSFLVLVLTGMPLKFYTTRWAQALMAALGGVEAARALHRIGALITFAYFGMHLVALAVTMRQRRAEFRDPASGRFSVRRALAYLFGPDSPLPNLGDLRDFGAHVKWFLGRGPRPQFDRWTYWEKFDYWAVFWGVAVIGASGLILWGSQAAAWLMPGWMINVAVVVHSDEALLAAGFIFTIHFFNNHLRPENFPMDPIMFSGRISKAEMLHTRKRWHDRMAAAGQLDAWRVKDEWDSRKRIAGPFGYAALTVGVVLLVLIVSAMVPHLLH